jgi:hypothetical protein
VSAWGRSRVCAYQRGGPGEGTGVRPCSRSGVGSTPALDAPCCPVRGRGCRGVAGRRPDCTG